MPDFAGRLRRAYIPESVLVLSVGLVVGHAFPALRSSISADLVLFVLVPGLVFDAAFDIEWAVARRLLPVLIGLAVPGVVISAVVVAFALGPQVGLPFELAFTVGAITAATDPVAVVATLTRLDMPHRLRTLVEGESLLNDGTGLVLVALAVQAATGTFDVAEGALLFVITIVVSVAAGVAAGIIGTFLVRGSRSPAVALLVTLALAYATFAIAQLTGLSGVLATVVGATTLGTLLRRGWSDRVLAERIDRTWSGIAFALSALTFFAIGLVIDLPSLGGMLGPIAIGVVAVIGARAVIVYVPFALLRPPVPVGWAHVLMWSGLRGAIAFAAALALPVAFPRRLEVQEIAFGIVLVTLVAQAVLAPALVRAAIPARARD